MENLLDQAARIHFAQEPAVAVVLDQRRGLPLVRLDPLADDVLPVVRPDDQRGAALVADPGRTTGRTDRKSTRLNSSHRTISYAVFCLKKKKSNAVLCSFRTRRDTRRSPLLLT